MELLDIECNPAPLNASVGSIKTSDGIKLRHVGWLSESERSKGTVVLLQGRSEYVEKYFEVVTELRERGFSVVTFDWRGQGLSQRLLDNSEHGHVESFWDYVTDLETVFSEVVLPDFPPPYYAIAHSTGGAVLLLAAKRFQTRLSRVILSSPIVDFKYFMLPMRLSFLLLPILKYIGLGEKSVSGEVKLAYKNLPFEKNVLTSDADRYERFRRVLETQPALGLGPPTIGWLHAARQTFSSFKTAEFGVDIRLPMLIVAAGADQVVSNPECERLVARIPIAAYTEVSGAKHEILMERDPIRDQFWAAFDAFIPNK